MNDLLKLSTILILTATLLISFSCTSESGPSDQNEIAQNDEVKSNFPLIYQMSFMSRFTKKLWFSGIEENWELAGIYNHEIEEITEEIIEGNYTKNDINFSVLMETMLFPAIENLEESIDSRDRELFERRFNTLIQSCNSCHIASNYGAVRITVPEINPFNQDFSPGEF